MLFPSLQQFSADLLDKLWPVGSVHIRTDAQNPAAVFGVGVWQAIGSGQVLVGQDTNQTEFAALGQTGGAKTVTLTAAQLPAHNHTVTDPGHAHVQQLQGGTTGTTTGTHLMGSAATGGTLRAAGQSTATATTGITVNGGGSGQAHANLPPYLIVRFWQRIA